MKVVKMTLMSSQFSTYMIGDELVDFRDKVLVAIDAWKRARLDSSLVGKVSTEMSCTLINHTLNSQLPCGKIDVLDLKIKN